MLVSTGGFIEYVLTQGRAAVEQYIQESVAAVASPHLTNEESFRFAQMLRILDAVNVDVAAVAGTGDDLLIKAEKAANARGARDMGLRPAPDGVGLPGMLEAPNGRIRAFYICASDLWGTADRPLLQKAIARAEYVIVQDIFRSPLAERTHVVLPSLTFAEKKGTFTSFAGRVQRLRQAIQPPADQPNDGEIFSRILSWLAGRRWSFDPESVLEEIALSVPAYAGLTYDRVGRLGYALPDSGAAEAESPHAVCT